MFVAGDDVEEMTDKVRRFNKIRKELGLPPDQPTTLLWMYCGETPAEAEEGWTYFHNQLTAAQHHYFEWNNPGYEGIHGYEEYLIRQNADVGTADARFRRSARDPTHRYAGRDHREDQGTAGDHQPGKARDPHVLRRDAEG